MSKFKVGDRVEVVCEKNGHEFDIGSVVTIVNITDDDDDLPYYAKNDNGKHWWLNDREIKSVKKEAESPRQEFTVGGQTFYVGQTVWSTETSGVLKSGDELEVIGAHPDSRSGITVRKVGTWFTGFGELDKLATTKPKPHEWKFGDWARHPEYGVVFVVTISQEFPKEIWVNPKEQITWHGCLTAERVNARELTYISSATIPV